jgi:2-dehydro-3-deoxy-D-gluconate 5-dehydrogenase
VNSHSFDLTGQTAVVTGASRGIGKAVAVALARHGADIIGVSSTISRNSAELAGIVEDHGRAFSAVECDLSDRQSVTDLAAHLSEIKVDILINNAGITQRTPTLDHTDDMWDRVLQVNLTAPFVLARELGRQMVHRGSGKIVFIGSLWTFQGGLNVVSYTASKHAIAGITKAMANEWASRGVNVNAIAPGFIETDINANLKRDLPERYEFISSRIPQGRWGQAEDIAGAAVFLSSPAADYVQGSVLAVDGGWLAG